MIQSILDNDLYKFTMQQAVHVLYPNAEARYRFINRSGTEFPAGFARRLKAEIKTLALLKLSSKEKDYLTRTCPYLTPVYLDYLEHYRFDPDEISIKQNGGRLEMTVQGPWYRTILWEVPLMAVISELYFLMTDTVPASLKEQHTVNRSKAALLKQHGIQFADFGTRRRFSAQVHKQVISDLLDIKEPTLIGTSNVHLARCFNLRPVGTLAHEWIMFHASLCGYPMANASAMDAWVKIYQGRLGIALSDTYTTPFFLTAFDSLRARIFDGVRQDSGDPFGFTETILCHYQNLGINPCTKIIVFSDGLTADKAVSIHQHIKDRIQDLYGIGTHLTNDVGATPLNMVIKLVSCTSGKEAPWRNTIKLSDESSKHTGDPEEIKTCMTLLQI